MVFIVEILLVISDNSGFVRCRLECTEIYLENHKIWKTAN